MMTDDKTAQQCWQGVNETIKKCLLYSGLSKNMTKIVFVFGTPETESEGTGQQWHVSGVLCWPDDQWQLSFFCLHLFQSSLYPQLSSSSSFSFQNHFSASQWALLMLVKDSDANVSFLYSLSFFIVTFFLLLFFFFIPPHCDSAVSVAGNDNFHSNCFLSCFNFTFCAIDAV